MMDRLNKIKECGNNSSLDGTLSDLSLNEAYHTADEGSASTRFCSVNDNTTLDVSDITNASFDSNQTDDTNRSASNTKLPENYNAVNILSGEVNIFDENSVDEPDLIIDDTVSSDFDIGSPKNDNTVQNPTKCSSFISTDNLKNDKFIADEPSFAERSSLIPNISQLSKKSSLAQPLHAHSADEKPSASTFNDVVQSGDNVDIGSPTNEVILQIDGKNVDAIDVGNGLYLYRKDGTEELTSVQIIQNEGGEPQFKFLKVRQNEEGNLEVYEEQIFEVPVGPSTATEQLPSSSDVTPSPPKEDKKSLASNKAVKLDLDESLDQKCNIMPPKIFNLKEELIPKSGREKAVVDMEKKGEKPKPHCIAMDLKENLEKSDSVALKSNVKTDLKASDLKKLIANSETIVNSDVNLESSTKCVGNSNLHGKGTDAVSTENENLTVDSSSEGLGSETTVNSNIPPDLEIFDAKENVECKVTDAVSTDIKTLTVERSSEGLSAETTVNSNMPPDLEMLVAKGNVKGKGTDAVSADNESLVVERSSEGLSAETTVNSNAPPDLEMSNAKENVKGKGTDAVSTDNESSMVERSSEGLSAETTINSNMQPDLEVSDVKENVKCKGTDAVSTDNENSIAERSSQQRLSAETTINSNMPLDLEMSDSKENVHSKGTDAVSRDSLMLERSSEGLSARKTVSSNMQPDLKVSDIKENVKGRESDVVSTDNKGLTVERSSEGLSAEATVNSNMQPDLKMSDIKENVKGRGSYTGSTDNEGLTVDKLSEGLSTETIVIFNMQSDIKVLDVKENIKSKETDTVSTGNESLMVEMSLTSNEQADIISLDIKNNINISAAENIATNMEEFRSEKQVISNSLRDRPDSSDAKDLIKKSNEIVSDKKSETNSMNNEDKHCEKTAIKSDVQTGHVAYNIEESIDNSNLVVSETLSSEIIFKSNVESVSKLTEVKESIEESNLLMSDEKSSTRVSNKDEPTAEKSVTSDLQPNEALILSNTKEPIESSNIVASIENTDVTKENLNTETSLNSVIAVDIKKDIENSSPDETSNSDVTDGLTQETSIKVNKHLASSDVEDLIEKPNLPASHKNVPNEECLIRKIKTSPKSNAKPNLVISDVKTGIEEPSLAVSDENPSTTAANKKCFSTKTSLKSEFQSDLISTDLNKSTVKTDTELANRVDVETAPINEVSVSKKEEDDIVIIEDGTTNINSECKRSRDDSIPILNGDVESIIETTDIKENNDGLQNIDKENESYFKYTKSVSKYTKNTEAIENGKNELPSLQGKQESESSSPECLIIDDSNSVDDVIHCPVDYPIEDWEDKGNVPDEKCLMDISVPEISRTVLQYETVDSSIATINEKEKLRDLQEPKKEIAASSANIIEIGEENSEILQLETQKIENRFNKLNKTGQKFLKGKLTKHFNNSNIELQKDTPTIIETLKERSTIQPADETPKDINANSSTANLAVSCSVRKYPGKSRQLSRDDIKVDLTEAPKQSDLKLEAINKIEKAPASNPLMDITILNHDKNSTPENITTNIEKCSRAIQDAIEVTEAPCVETLMAELHQESSDKKKCPSDKDKSPDKTPVITEVEFDKFVRRNSTHLFEECILLGIQPGKRDTKMASLMVVTTTPATTTTTKDLMKTLSEDKKVTNNPILPPKKNYSANLPARTYSKFDKQKSVEKEKETKIHMPLKLEAKRISQNKLGSLVASQLTPLSCVVVNSNDSETLVSHDTSVSPAVRSDVGSTNSGSLESDPTSSADESFNNDSLQSKSKHPRKQILKPNITPESDVIFTDILEEDKDDAKNRPRKRKSAIPKPEEQAVKDILGDNSASSKTKDSLLPKKKLLARASELALQNETKPTISESVKEVGKPVVPEPKITPKRGRPKKSIGGSNVSPVVVERQETKSQTMKENIDNEDGEDDNEVKENWTMGKIDENIVCPICQKRFRSENVVFKHVKHCSGSNKESPVHKRKSLEQVKDDSKKSIESPLRKRKSLEHVKDDPKKSTESPLRKRKSLEEVKDVPKKSTDSPISKQKSFEQVKDDPKKCTESPLRKRKNLEEATDVPKKSTESPIRKQRSFEQVKDDPKESAESSIRKRKNLEGVTDVPKKEEVPKKESSIRKQKSLDQVKNDSKQSTESPTSKRKTLEQVKNVPEQSAESPLGETLEQVKDDSMKSTPIKNVKSIATIEVPSLIKNTLESNNIEKENTNDYNTLTEESESIIEKTKNVQVIESTVIPTTSNPYIISEKKDNNDSIVEIISEPKSKTIEILDTPVVNVKNPPKPKFDIQPKLDFQPKSDIQPKLPIRPKKDKKLDTPMTRLKKILKTNPPVENLTCEICNKSFRQLAYLVNHRTIHKSKTIPETVTKPVNVVTVNMFPCDVCEKKYRKSHHLVQHKQTHIREARLEKEKLEALNQPVAQVVKDPSIPKEDQATNSSSITSGGFRCEACGKSFRKLHHLVEHREIHDANKVSSPQSPQSPQPSYSTKDIIHECPQCYMVFPNEPSLSRHITLCQRKKNQSKSVSDAETGDEMKSTESEIVKEAPALAAARRVSRSSCSSDRKSISSKLTDSKGPLSKIIIVNDAVQPKPKPIVNRRHLSDGDTAKYKLADDDVVRYKLSPAFIKATKRHSTHVDFLGTPSKVLKKPLKKSESTHDDFLGTPSKVMKKPLRKSEFTSLLKKKIEEKQAKPKAQETNKAILNKVIKKKIPGPIPKEALLKKKDVPITKRKSMNVPKTTTVKISPKKRASISSIGNNTVKASVESASEEDDATIRYSFPKPEKPIKKASPVKKMKSIAESSKVLKDAKVSTIPRPPRKSLQGVTKRKSLLLKKSQLENSKTTQEPKKLIKAALSISNYLCDCGEKFSSSTLLARHIRIAHTPPRGRRPFIPPDSKPDTSKRRKMETGRPKAHSGVPLSNKLKEVMSKIKF